MSDKDKRKNLPLPSILSNIRNAGRSSIYQQEPIRASTHHEIQPLMMESSSSSPINNITTPRRIRTKVSRFFDNVQNMPMFERNRNRFRGRRERGRGRGFKVDLPPKFIIYTIFIFIILPLVLGSFFLIKQVLFGSLKEDESHPLHKKPLRFRSNPNTTQVDGQNTNFTEVALNLESPESPVIEHLNNTHDLEYDVPRGDDNLADPILNGNATVAELTTTITNGDDISTNAEDASDNAIIVVTTGSPKEDQTQLIDLN